MQAIMETKLGKIYMAREALAKIAGYATTECYGVVGMAKRTPTDFLQALLKRENLAQGVDVQFLPQGVTLTLFVILEFGVRISEVVRNIQDQVRFRIASMTHLDNFQIEIVVSNVRTYEG